MGRTCDYIIGSNGEFLHWAYFWHLVFDSKIAETRDLKKFQIVQESDSSLLIRLVSNRLSAKEEAFLREDLINRLGDMSVKLSYESAIENSSTGKYRPVVNKLL
jgi:hypothetical protein